MQTNETLVENDPASSELHAFHAVIGARVYDTTGSDAFDALAYLLGQVQVQLPVVVPVYDEVQVTLIGVSSIEGVLSFY